MKDKKFVSVFATEIQNFIALKRSMGYKYESEEAQLRGFDCFLVETGQKEKSITKELWEKWITRRDTESVRTQQIRISALKGFTQYLSELGMKVHMPRKGLVKNPPRFVPHIYTEDELKRFFYAVDHACCLKTKCPGQSLVMPVFFRILYTSGLRVSELRLARVKDMDLQNGVISVRGAKNHKDRLVPIHPKLLAATLFRH